MHFPVFLFKSRRFKKFAKIKCVLPRVNTVTLHYVPGARPGTGRCPAVHGGERWPEQYTFRFFGSAAVLRARNPEGRYRLRGTQVGK